MPSSPELWVAAVLGFGTAMGMAFAVIAFLDHRYITRLEYAATLARIDENLKRLGRDAPDDDEG